MLLRHVALAVQDEQRSREFYERWFGFGVAPPRRYPDGVLMLYDVTSTWLEGRCCPLARHGYSRDSRRDKLQIIVGLLCAADG